MKLRFFITLALFVFCMTIVHTQTNTTIRATKAEIRKELRLAGRVVKGISRSGTISGSGSNDSLLTQKAVKDYVTVSSSYAGNIPFSNLVTDLGTTTLTTTLTPTRNTTNQQTGFGAIWKVVANGTDSVNLTNFKIAGDGVFDKTNGILNLLMFMYDGTNYWVGIIQEGNGVPADVIPPSLSTAIVTNVDRNKIILTYNETLDASSVPGTPAFSASGGKTITGVTVSGAIVTITVNSNYAAGDVITITYNPGASPIRDAAGNNASSLAAQSVSNNIETTTNLTYTIRSAAFTGSSSPYTSTSASPNFWDAYALADYKMAGNGSIQMDVASTNNRAMIGFNIQEENVKYGGANNGYEYFAWFSDGTLYRGYNGGNVASIQSLTPTATTKLRLSRTGSTVTVQLTTDGTSYSTIYTYPTTTSATLFIIGAIENSSYNLLNPSGANVIAR